MSPSSSRKYGAHNDRPVAVRTGRVILSWLVVVLWTATAVAAAPQQTRDGATTGIVRSPVTPNLPPTMPVPAQAVQENRPGVPANSSTPSPSTPLAKLVEEAQQNNPQIVAALRAWQAAEQTPSQVSTLPDPQVMVQHVSAGTPIPGWNFETVPMAFVGIGISQDLPYPGKLRLRGEMARSQAGALGDHVESVRRAVAAQVKITYFHLSYVQEALEILARNQALISQVENIAEARYRVGQGTQQDVLKAQLEQTKLLRDLAQYQQQSATLQARLKELLNRVPDSPDVAAAPLVETPLSFSPETLRAMVRTDDPNLRAQQKTVTGRGIGVELARKDFYPDFHFQYMYQQTGSETPNRYALTFGIKIPIYHGRRQEPELAQAAAQLNQSRRQYEADLQQAYFDVQDQYLAADADSKVLKIYREGLIPQATAAFQTGLSAYQVGSEDFQSLLDSFLDVLNLDTEYWRTLADHESALARLEQLTGVSLP